MYWNVDTDDFVDDMRKIKSNMRCIETLSNAGGNAGRAAIKSNMRCIETLLYEPFVRIYRPIKSNMRCIETSIRNCIAEHTVDKE